MKASWNRIRTSRYGWSMLGGLALAAAFPKLNVAGLAWIAPGWILFASLGRPGADVFRISYVGGLAYALAAFYWILLIPFPPGAIAGWLALGAYLALYTALWGWMCWRIFPADLTGEPSSASATTEPALVGATTAPVSGAAAAWLRAYPAVQNFRTAPLIGRVGWALNCAVIWVALEMILARLFTGFPWNLLGVSQYQVVPLIQMAPWTGVYGISFLVVWFSVSVVSAALQLMSSPGQRSAWVGDLILPLIVVLVVIAQGSGELARMAPSPSPIRMGEGEGAAPQPSPLGKREGESGALKAVLIQPSIPQTLIWDTNQNALRFTQLIQLSERALQATTNAQLLVWPEAAVPNMLRYEPEVYRAVTNLAITQRVWMILGSDDAAPREGALEREFDFFNSSFLVTPRGEIAAFYRKRRLVIFGEYIPLERWIPFMKYLTPVGGSFAAGKEPRPFAIPELGAKVSVLICFEDIFPHYSREYVEEDTDFLLNLTNNGWFGESAAQWQHAANAVFRAVENRIPLVRCANNGLTCWVDRWGRLHEVFFPNSQDVYGAGFKVVEVPLLAKGERRALTFYTRHGDWFGWGCVGGTAALLLWSWAGGRSRFPVL